MLSAYKGVLVVLQTTQFEEKWDEKFTRLANVFWCKLYILVRAHFRNFWLGKAFFSRIWHAVVFTQFGNSDYKSAPCQAIFCVFPTQNSKTKWPPKLVKMSQLYITAWLTMNIKTSFRCIKTHLSNILKVPWISPCAFAARRQNPKWPPLQVNVL